MPQIGEEKMKLFVESGSDPRGGNALYCLSAFWVRVNFIIEWPDDASILQFFETDLPRALPSDRSALPGYRV